MSSKKDKDELGCSFCGKLQKEVKKIIAGPAVFICNECVNICNEVLADDAQVEAATGSSSPISHVGMFTCPKCRSTFALHAQHSDSSDS